jgi:hypothetical protein
MAVLCEALSVLIRSKSLDSNFTGGRRVFVDLVPNDTFCTDGELVRVGFMTPDDVKDFVDELERYGLLFRSDNERETDVVVVDQINGPLAPCNWLDCYRMCIGGHDWVTAARLSEPYMADTGQLSQENPSTAKERREELFVPAGWTFHGSLSDSGKFVATDDIPRRLRFLREQDGLDVYWDSDLEREMYIGRTR